MRLPNLFTVLADVSAAFLLVAHGPFPLGRFACVLIAGVLLYWAGMVLNDVFDVERDRQERPTRPIPAGDISISQATIAGWTLLIAGIVLAAASGLISSSQFAVTWLPGLVALVLAVMIVLYDGPLKKTPLAPAAMGSCRVLSFLLGASPCIAMVAGEALFPQHVMAIALGFGVYIMGITTMARREAVGETGAWAGLNITTGFVVMLVGMGIIAFGPSVSGDQVNWRMDPHNAYPILVGLISLPVALRALKIQTAPTPKNIQNAIRAGILSIIPLASAVALLGAGRIAAICVFALVVPAIILAKRLRVT
ncbi:prenyltransferase [Planctomycetes bacterium K23_9]|uniref:Prenyltransferase n=1 Tax=Stieleria marina TaxID=1930275 RepID=A0A517NPQ4_9BACT|nr:prenyltransferase [Planctomycetes bacterium K23_9]